MDLNDARLDSLVQNIDSFRRRLSSNSNFEDVEYIATGDELQRIKAQCCHIIEARRGCGKTTFIRKALQSDNVLSIFIDCQKYTSLKSDDIILDMLNKLVSELDIYTKEESFLEIKRKYTEERKGLLGLWRKLFKKIDQQFVNEYKNLIYLCDSLSTLKRIIASLKVKPEDQIYEFIDTRDNSSSKKETKTFKKSGEATIETQIGGKFEVPEFFSCIEAVGKYQECSECETEEEKIAKGTKSVSTKYSRTVHRSTLIDNLVECFSKLFMFIQKTYMKDVVLFLDDFYQIEMEKQPRLLQYFHGIYKESGTAFYFNVVAIPDSVKINEDGQTTFSLKDDFPVIHITYDLSNMERLTGKLLAILVSLSKDRNISSQEILSLFTKDTLTFLVMAAGGIPRDFMALFSDVRDVARNNANRQIQKTDLYAAVRSLREEKEREKDADLRGYSKAAIQKAIAGLEALAKAVHTNVILYPEEQYKEHEKLLKALVNLRYIHVICERVTPEGKNRSTVALLIDMTLYTSKMRLDNNFKICEFWVKTSKSNEMRRAPIRYFTDELMNELALM